MNKFNIGEWIWFVWDDKVVSKQVRLIEEKEYDGHIEYGFKNAGVYRSVEARRVYATKDELLKNL